MEYGKKIAQLRNERQMTQEQLASRLFVSRDLVSKWEIGARRPDFSMLTQLATVLDVEVDFFAEPNERLLDELAACFPDGFDADADELTDLLNRFLQTLSERDGNIFVRRYYFMESFAQIGARYRLSEGYVRVVLSRIRRKFKHYLEVSK